MKKASKKKSILKGIIDFGMYNTLEERLRNSPEYKKSRKRVGKALKKLDDLGLSEEQMDVIDDVLTVCNENAAIYGRKAYIQGFKDAIAMILEVAESFAESLTLFGQNHICYKNYVAKFVASCKAHK